MKRTRGVYFLSTLTSSPRPDGPALMEDRPMARTLVRLTVAITLAISLGGCVIAGPGYYRPYPHYWWR